MPGDEQLALGLQRGNADALAALVERHHGRLLGFLYRLTGGDRALAEDLAQETFLRAIRSIGRYHHPRPFKPWLYAIAVNLARDHFKQAETRRTDSAADREAEWNSARDAADGVEADLLAESEARQVAEAVAQLPAHQREAVVLRYYQDLSLAEMADVLGVPVGTVKSRISLGLKRLREMMRDEG